MAVLKGLGAAAGTLLVLLLLFGAVGRLLDWVALTLTALLVVVAGILTYRRSRPGGA